MYTQPLIPADSDNSVKRWTYSHIFWGNYSLRSIQGATTPFIYTLLLHPKITKASQFWELLSCTEEMFKALSLQQCGHQHWQRKHWRGTWVYAKISFITKKSKIRSEGSKINTVPVFPLTSPTTGKTLVWILVKSGLQHPSLCVIRKHWPCWNALLITQPCKNY